MLDVALDLARQNPNDKYKFASVITSKRNKIVGIGFNSYSKSHPLQFEYGRKHTTEKACFLHSELSAIIRAKGKGSTMYVARVDKRGNAGMSRPCPACLAAIENETKIKKVVYTIHDNEYGVIKIER